MRPKKQDTTRSSDLFRARLDQIINLKHELAQLADAIDWDWIDDEIAPLYSEKGRPGIETRFAIGLLLLKHIYGLSDEGVCDRWVYDPYFQHFTGEEFFQHSFPHERSDLSHWRKRLGDKLELLLAESLRVAHASGALRTRDLKRVTVDTTVQPKNISFPTDAKLLHAAIKGLNRLAQKHGVRLRQSYIRVAKRAAMMAGRYAHAKQFNRHRRLCRQRIPRPRCAKSRPRLHLGTEARRLRRHQTRTATPIRNRARDRPHEGRRSPRPLLPQRPRRRCRQHHPHRCRLQLPTHPCLAEGSLTQYSDRNIARLHDPISAQSGLLTDDGLRPCARRMRPRKQKEFRGAA